MRRSTTQVMAGGPTGRARNVTGGRRLVGAAGASAPPRATLRSSPGARRAPIPASGRSPRRGVGIERKLIPAVDIAVVALAMTLTGVPLPVAAAGAGWFWALLTAIGDYDRPRVSLSAMQEAPRLSTRLALMVLILSFPLTMWSGEVGALTSLTAAAAGVLLGRFATFSVVRSMRRRGVLSARTLVVGAGAVGRGLAGYLAQQPQTGMQVVGVVDDPDHVHDTTLVGSLDDLPGVVERFGIERVVITFGAVRDWRLVDVIRQLPADDVDVLVVPRLFEVGAAASDPSAEDVGGVPLVWIHRRSSRVTSQRCKRGFDLFVAAAMLVLATPLMALCAAAVLLSSRGPILFRQERLGLHGRRFTLFKFRSMRVNDDSETLWTVRNDQRLTSIGRHLRRLNLDELPQLINVLRGDMSLVGPRPERPHFVERFAEAFPGYSQRHRSPAGLTGWAQIHGLRGDTSIEDRIRFDNFYIDNWTIWGDMTILLRTLTAFNRNE